MNTGPGFLKLKVSMKRYGDSSGTSEVLKIMHMCYGYVTTVTIRLYRGFHCNTDMQHQSTQLGL